MHQIFVESVTATARSHFQSPDRAGQGRQQLVFTIDKSIVECIIGEMMYASTDDDISTAGNDEAVLDDEDVGGIDIESSRFYTAAEQEAPAINDHRMLATRTKAQALS